MISIHFPCMERDRTMTGFNIIGFISIRSSRMGETGTAYQPSEQERISIHSPHTGRDPTGCHCQSRQSKYNPLFPYGKRPAWRQLPSWCCYFNPLSPHGKRRGRRLGKQPGRRISIHSPRTGRDTTGYYDPDEDKRFQSTLPTRGETYAVVFRLFGAWTNFNPLFPYGKRPAALPRPTHPDWFQSPLPAREETLAAIEEQWAEAISIHSPHTGRDPAFRWAARIPSHFNPLSPHGERLDHIYKVITGDEFQSPLPIREETDGTLGGRLDGVYISIHSSRTGRD